jgi:hypothetical protein
MGGRRGRGRNVVPIVIAAGLGIWWGWVITGIASDIVAAIAGVSIFVIVWVIVSSLMVKGE